MTEFMSVIINEEEVRFNLETKEIWMKDNRCKKYEKWVIRKGSNNGRGYLQIWINYKLYKCHRIIYKIYNPEWNIEDNSRMNEIDHFDGNRKNNDISNLSVVTHQQNLFNKRSCKGYYFHKQKNKWIAKVWTNNKPVFQKYYKTEEEARSGYIEAKFIHHGIRLD